jgi:hypothetical protein
MHTSEEAPATSAPLMVTVLKVSVSATSTVSAHTATGGSGSLNRTAKSCTWRIALKWVYK